MIKEIQRTELRRKRKAAGLSQFDVAYKVGVSPSWYQRIEAGYCVPSEEDTVKLTQLFNLPQGYFKQNMPR